MESGSFRGLCKVLAGLAVGIYRTPQDIAHHWSVDRTFEPTQSVDEISHRRALWRKALARSLDWQDH